MRGPLAAITRASDRLRDTVQRLSDLVDLEAAANAALSTTDLRGLLSDSIDRHRNQGIARGVTIELECADSLTWQLDAPLVKRSLSALIDNAVTYAPSGHPSVRRRGRQRRHLAYWHR